MTTTNYTEAYSRLEGDGPPIYHIVIQLYLDHNECVSVKMMTDKLFSFDYMNDKSPRFEYRYSFNHHGELIKRMGIALGRNTDVHDLELVGEVDDEIDISNGGVECLRAFYDGVKQNASIIRLLLNLDIMPHARIPILEIGSRPFAKSLQELTIFGQENMNDYQSFKISNWLEDMSSLDILDITRCRFGLNESPFRRVILACSQVYSLSADCMFNYQYAALATLLRDARSGLSQLDLTLHENSNRGEGLANIAHSLVVNKYMKLLKICSHPPSESDFLDIHISPLAKSLCDVSSIENIQSSNHILEKVAVDDDVVENPFIEACLRLNRMKNKEQVIQKKIARYYFDGCFDVSPFSSMPISVLPRVLELIEGEVDYRLNATFRMLRCIPELCNLYGRGDHRGTKRQKCLK